MRHDAPKPWERRFWSQAYRGFRLGAAFGWGIGCAAAALTYVVVVLFFR